MPIYHDLPDPLAPLHPHVLHDSVCHCLAQLLSTSEPYTFILVHNPVPSEAPL